MSKLAGDGIDSSRIFSIHFSLGFAGASESFFGILFSALSASAWFRLALALTRPLFLVGTTAGVSIMGSGVSTRTLRFRERDGAFESSDGIESIFV